MTEPLELAAELTLLLGGFLLTAVQGRKLAEICRGILCVPGIPSDNTRVSMLAVGDFRRSELASALNRVRDLRISFLALAPVVILPQGVLDSSMYAVVHVVEGVAEGMAIRRMFFAHARFSNSRGVRCADA